MCTVQVGAQAVEPDLEHGIRNDFERGALAVQGFRGRRGFAPAVQELVGDDVAGRIDDTLARYYRQCRVRRIVSAASRHVRPSIQKYSE